MVNWADVLMAISKMGNTTLVVIILCYTETQITQLTMNCCIYIEGAIPQTGDTYLRQTTLLPPVKQEITDNLILQRDTNY